MIRKTSYFRIAMKYRIMVRCLSLLFLFVLGVSQSYGCLGEPVIPSERSKEMSLHVCQRGDSLLIETTHWGNVDLKVFTRNGRLIIHSDVDEDRKTFPLISGSDKLYYMAKVDGNNILGGWVATMPYKATTLACD